VPAVVPGERGEETAGERGDVEAIRPGPARFRPAAEPAEWLLASD
jgi:hypothetical protein